MSMKCPSCGLINPDSALRCDCGYNFDTKTVDSKQSLVTNTPTFPSAAATGLELSGPQVRPWVRYWARMMDVLLFATLSGIVLAIVYEPALEIPEALLGLIILTAYVFVESAMLARWGTTPGKAILKVRLRKSTGDKLSFPEALSRSGKVWVRGLGLGIPIVNLVTLLHGYRRLKERGITSWDEEEHLRVSHQEVSPSRAILVFLILVAFFFLIDLPESWL